MWVKGRGGGGLGGAGGRVRVEGGRTGREKTATRGGVVRYNLNGMISGENEYASPVIRRPVQRPARRGWLWSWSYRDPGGPCPICVTVLAEQSSSHLSSYCNVHGRHVTPGTLRLVFLYVFFSQIHLPGQCMSMHTHGGGWGGGGGGEWGSEGSGVVLKLQPCLFQR